MKKNLPFAAVSIYALLLAIGGIIGFNKAGSVPSLVAGLVSGIFVGYTGYGIYKGCNTSRTIATVLVAGLGAFFSYRFYLTQAFMPAGLMIILSLVTFLILISTFCSCKKSCQ